MISHTLKLTVIVASAMTVIAYPAFANTAHKRASATEAYAMVTDASPKVMVVGWDGRNAGYDPDLNIRFQLMRDAFANEN